MVKRKPADPKVDALKEHGALNHRPKSVTDEVFRAHLFFDARDLVQVKYEMLRRVRLEGHSVTQAAAAFGFSRLSFYQTRKAFERDGLAGLIPKKRGPHGPHKITDEVIAFLKQVRDEDPLRRPPELTKLVKRQFGIRVHPRTIERSLAGQEKKRKRIRRT